MLLSGNATHAQMQESFISRADTGSDWQTSNLCLLPESSSDHYHIRSCFLNIESSPIKLRQASLAVLGEVII